MFDPFQVATRGTVKGTVGGSWVKLSPLDGLVAGLVVTGRDSAVLFLHPIAIWIYLWFGGEKN